MKFVTYKKYQGDGFDSMDMDELLERLSDFLLHSGFQSEAYHFSEMQGQRTLEQLRQAILDALMEGSLFDNEKMQEMLEKLRNMTAEQRDQLADRLIERLQEEGYVSITAPPEPTNRQEQAQGQGGWGEETHAKFELTDKSLDFLGFKTLKDLLGSLGKSSFG